MSTTLDFLIYGYVPSLAWNATFLALFSASFFVHLYQATRSRYWILYPTLALGALIELMGYAARVWSNKDVYNLNGYLMQICLLVMAPVFFSAYCYVVLGTAIHRLGERFSCIPSGMYFVIFITADIISLILQAVGGGQAASGASDSAPTTSATNIMLAGIIFQLISMGVFIVCGLDFSVRVVRNKPYAYRLRAIEKKRVKRAEKELGAVEQGMGEMGVGSGTTTPLSERTLTQAASAPVSSSTTSNLDAEKIPAPSSAAALTPTELHQWRLILISVLVSSAMILVRGVFRSVELSEGWGGYIISHEIYQMCLDGIPMVIAVGVFNFLHPGLILGRKNSWRGYY